MQQSQHCFCTTYLRSNIILIYAAALYLFTQQHYTYLCNSIAYAVISTLHLQHLFMQQHYTYLCSSTTYGPVLIYAALIYAASYLFTQLHYTYISALLMQQYYTYLHSSDILTYQYYTYLLSIIILILL